MQDHSGINLFALQAGQHAQPGQPKYETGCTPAYAASHAQEHEQPRASYGMEGVPGMPQAAAAGLPCVAPDGQVQRPHMHPSAEPLPCPEKPSGGDTENRISKGAAPPAPLSPPLTPLSVSCVKSLIQSGSRVCSDLMLAALLVIGSSPDVL